MPSTKNRREFLQTTSTAVATVGLAPYFAAAAEKGAEPTSKNDRLRFAAIGLRYQGAVIARHAKRYGDLVALCDVDADVLAKARNEFGDKAAAYEDYRKLLDRNDIDAVLIGTPDHWHAPMLIDACRAGKDVYCEKPLTLTIDEGKQILRVVEQTKRVVQVGSWQRSDSRFRLAAEIARAGRLGKIRKVSIVLGKNVNGGPFESSPVPANLNWDLWQGQTPDVPYIKERCHYTFRWWYEYAGGQLTDWGAHHIDIAQWALGVDHEGPVEVACEGNLPSITDGYNVALNFRARYTYADGTEMEVLDEGRNGILIEGTEGRLFVNRGSLQGKPVEELSENPLPREKYQLYAHDNRDRPDRAGKLDAIINHMGNFYDCVRSRATPISDVVTQHRSATACHLANISLRIGRSLRWDPSVEMFSGDDEANAYLCRTQRAGYEFSA